MFQSRKTWKNHGSIYKTWTKPVASNKKMSVVEGIDVTLRNRVTTREILAVSWRSVFWLLVVQTHAVGLVQTMEIQTRMMPWGDPNRHLLAGRWLTWWRCESHLRWSAATVWSDWLDAWWQSEQQAVLDEEAAGGHAKERGSPVVRPPVNADEFDEVSEETPSDSDFFALALAAKTLKMANGLRQLLEMYQSMDAGNDWWVFSLPIRKPLVGAWNDAM